MMGDHPSLKTTFFLFFLFSETFHIKCKWTLCQEPPLCYDLFCLIVMDDLREQFHFICSAIPEKDTKENVAKNNVSSALWKTSSDHAHSQCESREWLVCEVVTDRTPSRQDDPWFCHARLLSQVPNGEVVKIEMKTETAWSGIKLWSGEDCLKQWGV